MHDNAECPHNTFMSVKIFMSLLGMKKQKRLGWQWQQTVERGGPQMSEIFFITPTEIQCSKMLQF